MSVIWWLKIKNCHIPIFLGLLNRRMQILPSEWFCMGEENRVSDITKILGILDWRLLKKPCKDICKQNHNSLIFWKPCSQIPTLINVNLTIKKSSHPISVAFTIKCRWEVWNNLGIARVYQYLNHLMMCALCLPFPLFLCLSCHCMRSLTEILWVRKTTRFFAFCVWSWMGSPHCAWLYFKLSGLSSTVIQIF